MSSRAAGPATELHAADGWADGEAVPRPDLAGGGRIPACR